MPERAGPDKDLSLLIVGDVFDVHASGPVTLAEHLEEIGEV